MAKAEARRDLLHEMLDWETGKMDTMEQLVALFQALVDNGMAWTLRDCYGRQAKQLIEAGYVDLPSQQAKDEI